MSFSTLVQACKSISSLQGFMLSGKMAHIIADDELAAAKEALSKVPIAADKHGQVWSAVNHLEAAHQRYSKIHRNVPLLAGWAHIAYVERVEWKDRLTLCYMAACYQFLGEKTLSQKALAEASFEANTQGSIAGLIPFATLLSLPAVAHQKALANNEEKIEVQHVHELAEVIAANLDR